jgi:hypothetical protein
MPRPPIRHNNGTAALRRSRHGANLRMQARADDRAWTGTPAGAHSTFSAAAHSDMTAAVKTTSEDVH